MRFPRTVQRVTVSLALVVAGVSLTVVTSAPEAVAATCGGSTSGAFTPTRAVISGFGTKAMIPVGTTPRGALATPPKTTAAGMQQVGWYRNGYLPGQGYSVALDAHSWFRGPGGTLRASDRNAALGNALLLGFKPGSTITLYNSNGRKHICYRYASKTSYSSNSMTPMRTAVLTHREQVGIIVCSGIRSASGNYSQRTLFVAVR